MRLIIAEKPSLAQAIAENISSPQRKNGCFLCGETIVTWCYGHLLELVNPEDYSPTLKKWDRSTLPIIPTKWKLKPKASSAAQLAIIKDLLKATSLVVNAGDPDREGQLLVDEVLEYCGYKGQTKRLWLSSLDAKSVAKALAELTDNAQYASLRDSARARSQADWLIGINATRALTLFGNACGRQEMLSLGRVQTPTLALVVNRDKEIAAFRPQDYLILQATFNSAAGESFLAKFMPSDTQLGLDAQGRLRDLNIAQTIATESSQAKGLVTEVSREKKKTQVPLPHCLSSLQKLASARFGLTAQATLDIVQSLYEKKLTTYPRTDCRYLPEEQFSCASQLITTLGQLPDLATISLGADTSLHGQVWDTKKVTAHHAIIPTGEMPSNLTAMEKEIYLVIAISYCLQFYKPCLYEAQKITAQIKDTFWESKGRLIIEPGWTAASKPDTPEEESKEQDLPQLQANDSVACQAVEIQKKKTTPPAKFTEGTLIEAMANVHKFVSSAEAKATLKENDGIGTEATRASILEALKKRGYLIADKKSLVSTKLGQEVIELTPDSLKDPVTTAIWERHLNAILKGQETLTSFMAEQSRILPELLETIFSIPVAPVAGSHLCPTCGKILQQRKGQYGIFWSCTGYPECKESFADAHGQPGSKKSATTATQQYFCPECNEELKYYKNKKGNYCFTCFAKEKHQDNKVHFFNAQNGKPVFGGK